MRHPDEGHDLSEQEDAGNDYGQNVTSLPHLVDRVGIASVGEGAGSVGASDDTCDDSSKKSETEEAVRGRVSVRFSSDRHSFLLTERWRPSNA